MRIIDLRSDTVTKPTPAMREAMFKAEVGDDVYGDDPTVNKLEELAAKMLGKEAALFVCSGTMGNLLALLTHCTARGDEAIVGSESHIVIHEQGGAAALAGVALRMVKTQHDGTMLLEDIEESINPDDIHFTRSKLLCLENTWHGVPLSLEYMKDACALGRKHGLLLHLDGARIFNAATALGVTAKEVAAPFDTVQFCFSKGLSAPMGSALCGSRQFIERARRLRKMVGGGMRQVGIVAAAAIVGLEQMVERLAEDHANAKILCDELCKIDGLKVNKEGVRTNMVFFKISQQISQEEFLNRLQDNGLLACDEGRGGIRFVTHYGIDADDVREAAKRVALTVKQITEGTLAATAR
ncbi:MAG: low-specificity L-threonine aldolase [Candidatus Obscuribacterales bacterium]|nr:low-specificity L-threonine aldolase [Candidatus Obscuribacterales bacterium]